MAKKATKLGRVSIGEMRNLVNKKAGKTCKICIHIEYFLNTNPLYTDLSTTTYPIIDPSNH